MSNSYQVIFDVEVTSVSVLEALRQVLVLVPQESAHASIQAQVVEKKSGKRFLLDGSTGQATSLNTAQGGGGNDEDTEFPLRAWHYEVVSNGTRLGYLEWVRSQQECASSEEDVDPPTERADSTGLTLRLIWPKRDRTRDPSLQEEQYLLISGSPVSDLVRAALKIQQQPNDANAYQSLKRAFEAVGPARRASEAYRAEIAQAQDRYANDTCQIYNEAEVSEATDGVWVSAWVLVHFPDEEA